MKKDLIITALLTFCLTATVFMVATSQSAEYDPWVDLNDDGKIDIFDVVGMTSRYAATGDPTKNVTIAGHANKLSYSISGQSVAAGDTFYSPGIDLDGYSKVTVSLFSNTAPANAIYILNSRHAGGTYLVADAQTTGSYGSLVKTYDAPNQQVRVVFTNNDAVSRVLYLDIYLIP